MTELTNPIPEPAWADSDHLEQTYLMWQVTDHLGVLAIDEPDDAEPVILFLPFVDKPEQIFWEGKDERKAGLTLSELREVITALEKKLREHAKGS